MLVLLTNIATNEDLDPHLMAFRPALMHTCRPSLIPANLSTLAKFDSPMCVACVQMSPLPQKQLGEETVSYSDFS